MLKQKVLVTDGRKIEKKAQKKVENLKEVPEFITLVLRILDRVQDVIQLRSPRS